MICPITNNWCRTNGCGEKCYKRDSLGYATAPQHDAKLPVGSSTSTKELLECTVCWGGGKIEIDDFGNEENCTWCNGTGLVSRNL